VINNIQLQVRGDTICAGQTATIAVQGASSYTWNNGINSNSMVVSPGATTTYTVQGSIPGCTVTAVDSLKVLVHPLPQIQFNLSSVFCLEEDSMLVEPQPPGGILVGSAGTILTILMCKAMNRSLLNVVLGSFGSTSGAATTATQAGGAVKEIALSDAAILLSYSAKVVIVPGYGLAVAQAQHLCHELSKLLEEKGVEVKFAIHPVAGRMPGHMNVLLAEADVSYEKLVEMDEINPDLPNVDVVIVIGANDVVNPSATQDPGSPIYGMPVIKVWEAKNVIVIKRGMGKGYAAIENPLFTHDRTRMLFGDAKDALQKLISEIKAG
jgi:NAD/NADP transhydrogenase beta subunit